MCLRFTRTIPISIMLSRYLAYLAVLLATPLVLLSDSRADVFQPEPYGAFVNMDSLSIGTVSLTTAQVIVQAYADEAKVKCSRDIEADDPFIFLFQCGNGYAFGFLKNGRLIFLNHVSRRFARKHNDCTVTYDPNGDHTVRCKDGAWITMTRTGKINSNDPLDGLLK